MVKLVTTSVVRGSRQGESHGGVYLVDVEHQTVRQTLDWNKTNLLLDLAFAQISSLALDFPLEIV